MIAIVDYGLGNLHSVSSALEFLGAQFTVTDDPEMLRRAEKLILPGVGSFRTAMENIDARGLRGPLTEYVQKEGKPLLGICLGMQLLADWGEEDGVTRGLGFVPGRVERIPVGSPPLPLPHIGFNTARFVDRERSLFSGLGDASDFYFIHGYCFRCEEESDVSSTCEYGVSFTSSVQRGRVYGVQFHPEKSQTNGLRVLQRFVELEFEC